jgi:serine/threonine protein kinase
MNIGDIIDGYEIQRHIGFGGMGIVYEVIKDGNCYALKTCTDKDVEAITRFKREVRLMKSITDSRVIDIIDDNLDADPPYFVMTLCDQSLKDAVNNGLIEDEQFEYARQLCAGIKALHDGGVIHRDIKPANVLIIGDIIKVSDLGLGKFVNRDSTILTPIHDTTIGTLDYVAPEICNDGEGRGADARSDIYSIGKLLYFVFSQGKSPRFVDAEQVKADVFSIISKCTKISPTNRYQDVFEIINALHICQHSRKSIVSIKDVVSAHKTGINDAEFSDTLYRHLLTLQDDLGVLIRDLRTIGTENLKLLLKYKKNDVSNIINLLLTTYNNNNSYWIQFEDVDVLVGRARLLLQLSSSLQEKQELLEFSIEISKNYNRYPAMEIVGNMLHDFTEDEIKLMPVLFSTHKDTINDIKDNFRKSIPETVRLYLR